MLNHKTIAVIALTLSALFGRISAQSEPEITCDYQLVRTTPIGQVFPPRFELPFKVAETSEVFLELIQDAKQSIRITSVGVNLIPAEQLYRDDLSSQAAQKISEAIISAARDRKVKVEIMVSMDWALPGEMQQFKEAGIEVTNFDVESILGSGCQHSKFIVVDGENFYLGSANFDWRAVSHISETGIVYKNCPKLANELVKVFEIYKQVRDNKSVPKSLPNELISQFNATNRMTINMDGHDTSVYMAFSPKQFDGDNGQRSHDLESIISAIDRAKKFVYISVMSYNPTEKGRFRTYWPDIENAIKRAFYERGVLVKMMVASKQFNDIEFNWFKSMATLGRVRNPKFGGIDMRHYQVPIMDNFQANIPYGRLHHDKYVITDNEVLITTSNWAPAYFKTVTGVTLAIEPKPLNTNQPLGIIRKMRAIFEREFYSPFARSFNNFPKSGSPDMSLFKQL